MVQGGLIMIPDEGTLEQVAWMVASHLDGVVGGQPFGPGYDVFKVAGKVFMLTTEVPGRLVVTVKCEPEYATALRADFPTITPGYHMNKRHWISIANGRGITEDLVTDLVTNAYLLVIDTLPRRLRPPGPGARQYVARRSNLHGTSVDLSGFSQWSRRA